MYNGVIVKFAENKFSLKTQTKCYWCQSMYWNSEEKVREFIVNLHPIVLDQKEFISGFAMNNKIMDMLKE